MVRVSKWLLLSTNFALVQLYHGANYGKKILAVDNIKKEAFSIQKIEINVNH
jgi:hypothetical protein